MATVIATIARKGLMVSPSLGRARTKREENTTPRHNIKGFAVCWRSSATDATAVTPGGVITSGGDCEGGMGISRHLHRPPGLCSSMHTERKLEMGSTMPKSPVSNAWGARGALAAQEAATRQVAALVAHA